MTKHGVYLAQPYYLVNTNRYKFGMTEKIDSRAADYEFCNTNKDKIINNNNDKIVNKK